MASRGFNWQGPVLTGIVAGIVINCLDKYLNQPPPLSKWEYILWTGSTREKDDRHKSDGVEKNK